MNPADARLLRQIRRALATPFADPVNVDGATMSRATARMIERNLTCSTREVSAA